MEEIPRLLDNLRSSDEKVSVPAASKLGRYGGPQVVAGLLDVLDSTESQTLKLAIVVALGKLGGDDAQSKLCNLLESEDQRIRMYAAMGLGKIGTRLSVKPLLSALEHLDMHTRFYAAEALGAVGGHAAIRGLLDALKREADPKVRGGIVHALGELKAALGLTVLLETLDTDTNSVRVNAARALGAIGLEEAVPPLINATQSQNELLQKASIDALKVIGTPEALSAIENWNKSQANE